LGLLLDKVILSIIFAGGTGRMNYDELVDDYKKTKSNLMRKHIEKATVLSMLKDVQAKAVLDLACGEGNYTRTIKEYGARYVVGVDLSEKMITSAREEEKKQPLGIEYRVGDVRELEQIGLFDIATAVYLFPYAQTEQTLVDMAQAVYRNLKPNGRLIAVTMNPDLTEKHRAAPEKYGICVEVEDPLQDGAPIIITVFLPEGPLRIVNYYWSKETYERALKKAGFQKIEWRTMLVSEEGIKEYGRDFWEEYLPNPHIIVLECYK
jgi:2-polyprenyl-3-methyl-5-hydroxy-6-metoxy-1,4-benzoquinol methylase